MNIMTRLAVLAAGMLFLLSSCRDKELIDENQYVNKWIYKQMNIYYLWNNKITKSPNYAQPPELFFGSLLYKYDEAKAPDGDRFSWINPDYRQLIAGLSGVSSVDIGFDYMGVRVNGGTTPSQIYLLVTYPKKGSSAYSQGLKRGNIVVKINNTDITSENANSLLSGTGSKKLTVANLVFNPEKQTKELKPIGDITVEMHLNFAENPIYLDSIYNLNGKNIGYLVYNFFARDKGDGSHSYDKELMHKMEHFKSSGITEMVLDLRYNSGGAVSTAIGLASALVKDRSTSKVFGKAQYNPQLHSELARYYGTTDFNIDYFIEKIMDTTALVANVPSLGLQRLYVLTGKYTASASELIINGLIPHMDVVTIGETTYGKNVGSVTLYEENDPKNLWGLQPIVVKYYNANDKSDYTSGFTPNYTVDEWADADIVDFGDISDPLLNKALTEITGAAVTPVKQYVRGKADVHRNWILDRDKLQRKYPLIDDKREKGVRNTLFNDWHPKLIY